MDGYALRTSPSKGIHDELYARALYVEHGNEAISMVVLDLLYITQDLLVRIKRAVKEVLGIPMERVIVSATHTHSGPSIAGFHSVMRHIDYSWYMDALPWLAATAIAEASRRASKAFMRSATGSLPGWAVNRRRPLKGPIDPTVHLAVFEDLEGKVLGSIASYSAHPVVLGHTNLLYSADYPGWVVRTLETILGGVSLFITGSCGDVNPLTPGTSLERIYDRSSGTFEEAEEMGRAIAFEGLRAIQGARPSNSESLAYSSSKAYIDLRIPSSIEALSVEEARRALEEVVERRDHREIIKAWFTLKSIETAEALRKLYPSGIAEAEISGVRIGDLAIVAIPGEVFARTGIKIKEISSLANTIVAGYSNGGLGYLPPDEAFDEGGYETEFPVCFVSRGTEEKILKASENVLRELGVLKPQ
jgi:hypothetical protein